MTKAERAERGYHYYLGLHETYFIKHGIWPYPFLISPGVSVYDYD